MVTTSRKLSRMWVCNVLCKSFSSVRNKSRTQIQHGEWLARQHQLRRKGGGNLVDHKLNVSQ